VSGSLDDFRLAQTSLALSAMRHTPIRTASWVLIADADRPATLSLARYLDAFDVRSFPTRCGMEALGAARASRPGLVVVDVRLDDMTGYALLAGLRQLYDRIPVVMTCGDADPAHEIRAREAGVVHYTTKPIDLVRFEAIVNKARGAWIPTC
jgi:DNA-binding response OmpR family regulator